MGNTCSGESKEDEQEIHYDNSHGNKIGEKELREPLEDQTSKEDSLAEQIVRGEKLAENIIGGAKEIAKGGLKTNTNVGRLAPEHIQESIHKNNEDFYYKKGD